MSQASDVTAEHRVNFINYALSRWGDWQRMNVLRNALEELQTLVQHQRGRRSVAAQPRAARAHQLHQKHQHAHAEGLSVES